MDARIPHGVREKFSWALTFTAVVAACLALCECGGWAQGTTGPSLASEIQGHIQRLGDKDPKVRSDAIRKLANIGRDAKEAAPALITTLVKDTNADVRMFAAMALDQIGAGTKEAVPALVTALAKDTDANVRGAAAGDLGLMGAGTKEAVPAHSTALAKDTAVSVRRVAVAALVQVGKGAKEAAPALISALAKDTNAHVRSEAADALGQIGPSAKEAAPALITALAKDTDSYVRGAAAGALTRIAEATRDSRRTDMIEQLTQWAQALEGNSFPKEAATVRAAVDILRAIQPAWYEVLHEQAGRHPGLVGLVAAYLLAALLWLALLWKYPLALWRINVILAQAPKVKVKLPGWLGEMEISVANLCLVGFFHYHPRVLDDWVSRRIAAAQDQFCQIATVLQREVHVEVPVELDLKVIPGLKAEDLKAPLARTNACLLIWGEGGAGKTSLACQVVRWGMSEDAAMRPCAHCMLPVMIEQDLDLEVGQGRAVLTEVIRGELKKLTGDAEAPHQEMVRHLLKRKRVLLIVDGLSELNQATRNKLRPLDPEFAANALIVTSRIEETLDGVKKTTIHPMRIQGNRLSSFMEAYLGHRGKRSLFDDAEFFDGCSKLSVMVGDRDTTVLLAKLFAEQMVASKENPEQRKLPENIPDLMLQYLNELNRKGGQLEDRAVHSAAKSIAWECLKETFRPAPAKIEAVLAALGGDNAQDRVNYLERNLRLLQVIGPGRDRVKFALDPLAEYLAGLYLVEHYGGNEQLWRDFLSKADSAPNAPGAIKGFLLAVRDCCLTPDAERNVPGFVSIELASRVGLELRRTETGIAV